MNKEEFLKQLDELNINLTEKQLNQLETYANFLLSYNEHTNLTAIKKKEDVYLKHFYDSLTLVKYLNLNDYESLVDIGTGAGFPGMVLKTLNVIELAQIRGPFPTARRHRNRHTFEHAVFRSCTASIKYQAVSVSSSTCR